ncbi:2023_t:CDS:1, partial [Ambispora gerdemannii]
IPEQNAVSMKEEYNNDTSSSFSDTFNANNKTPITKTGFHQLIITKI